MEEALIEIYLAGVSVRHVEEITEALWAARSPSTISELNKKAHVNVDGIYLRLNQGGKFENVAVLMAIAVNEDGYREVLGATEDTKEDKAS